MSGRRATHGKVWYECKNWRYCKSCGRCHSVNCKSCIRNDADAQKKAMRWAIASSLSQSGGDCCRDWCNDSLRCRIIIDIEEKCPDDDDTPCRGRKGRHADDCRGEGGKNSRGRKKRGASCGWVYEDVDDD